MEGERGGGERGREEEGRRGREEEGGKGNEGGSKYGHHRIVFQVLDLSSWLSWKEVINSTCVGCYLKDSWPGVSMISRPGSLISVLANCGQRREDKTSP